MSSLLIHSLSNILLLGCILWNIPHGCICLLRLGQK
jgi:hypothetical protein